MKYLLAAINAKYIHSNLGVYSLKRYCGEKFRQAGRAVPQVELGEYTINHSPEWILQDIYRREPDVVGFSCYIWNISYVRALVRDLKKIRPGIHIWLGGPEVSWDAAGTLEELSEAELIMTGEGEETFFRLVSLWEEFLPGSGEWSGDFWEKLGETPGIAYRGGDGQICLNPAAPLLELDEIPFPYENLEGMEHRILYYESSRGCPFSCSYCLSSLDRTVRFRSLALVERELSFFLEKRVPQVKFVDRTFNCNRSHAEAIWRYLLEHDNGVTNFHFEISADLLSEEALSLFAGMRPGLIQLEIGVQSTNPDTIRAIRRTTDLERLGQRVRQVGAGRNIHQHLDLIAGLPGEDFESFRRSFNAVYALEPSQLQLGFLKVLKGSRMARQAPEYGLVFQSAPPYEVLGTRWLDYGELTRLKGVEEMVEVYYNSGQFRNTLRELEGEFADAFQLYDSLARYYREEGLAGLSHSRLARYEILWRFIRERTAGKEERFRDLLMCDLYLRENAKSRPSFARSLPGQREDVREFYAREAEKPRYLPGYEGYDSRQLARMTHLETMEDGSFVLFDYKNRDALFGNARALHLTAQELGSARTEAEMGEETAARMKSEAEAGEEEAAPPDSYVAIDLEMTGLNPRTERIIEIGAVRVEHGAVVETFSSLVNPGRALEAHVQELTGIRDGMLEDAPQIGEILPDILKFCGDLPLLGHQVLFDYSFLKKAAVNGGFSFEKTGIDTLFLCRRLMPAQEKKTLSEACRYYGVQVEESHRALADAMAAHGLYEAIKKAHPECPAELFLPKPLIYKTKREQPASKKQKEVLRDLLKYHKISLTVQIDSLSRNEVSRMTDKIISQYGRIAKR